MSRSARKLRSGLRTVGCCRWRSGNRATSTGVILDVLIERPYRSGVCIATVVLCLAACSSGGGKHAAATTTARSSPPATDTTTPPRCSVRAAGSPDADGTPAPGSDFPPADALPPAGTRPKTAEQAIKSALVFGISDGRTPPAERGDRNRDQLPIGPIRHRRKHGCKDRAESLRLEGHRRRNLRRLSRSRRALRASGHRGAGEVVLRHLRREQRLHVRDRWGPLAPRNPQEWFTDTGVTLRAL